MVIDKNKLIEDLKRMDKRVEGNLSSAKYRDIGKYSPASVQHSFGSWNGGKEAAGIETLENNGQKYYISVPRQKERISQIKKACGCSRCGYDEFAGSLEFHHTDKKNKVECIGQMVQSTYSWEAVLEETKSVLYYVLIVMLL